MSPKKRILLIVSAGVLLLIAAMSAMLSSSDEVSNRFRSGKFDIMLEEPSWSSSHDKVVPNEELPKDPQIRNKGDVDAFVFAEVIVPYYDELVTENSDGTGAAKKSLPVVKFVSGGSYDTTETEAQLVNSGWTAMTGTPVKDEENKVFRYIYAYTGADAASMETVAPDEVTGKLFDAVRFCNARESEADTEPFIENKSVSIRVNARGIQTEYLGADSASEPESVWAFLSGSGEGA
ncbi:hypothetical protein [Ruminococcus flavefaciens]|uniref:Uncharacterized protein n=1 Tax=Ruminococcus flavefaciens 007c TaxID=1341157 RepID=W7UH53_RUMFL|nr:hypothetical protein [Ruminococcus flavefaciens]EWM54536.1 hypothetical protein RF007C_01020 [Ruminococcus flavefaciens 007c]